ncbi:MAG TPA: hypothetical protein VIC85_05540 [Ktedonobacterales bacterium]|jgi:hypothetical protein
MREDIMGQDIMGEDSVREDSVRGASPAIGRAYPLSRRGVLLGAGGAAAVAVGGLWRPGTARAEADDAGGQSILAFHTMAPVTGAFVGPGMPIRGVPGGGIPWRLRAASGELRRDGRLRVRVRGLVLAAGPAEGTNPIPTFSAIVTFENAATILTEPFPASSEGNAEIQARLNLPSPGLAPIIFVGFVRPGPAPIWFAVTGNP